MTETYVSTVRPSRTEPYQYWYGKYGQRAYLASTRRPHRGVTEPGDFLPEHLREGYTFVRELEATERNSPSPLSLYRKDGRDVVVRKSELSENQGRAGHRATPEELHALQHPGLIRPVAQPQRDGRVYYEFYEYCPGGNLRAELLHQPGPQLGSAVLESVAPALAYLHKWGFVHRDVKPENIFRSADGVWVLGDLELVTHLGGEAEQVVRSNHEAGTYAYMPPERPISSRFDWYSFGLTLAETLTGQHPLFRVLGRDQVSDDVTVAELSEAKRASLEALCEGVREAAADSSPDRWLLLLTGLLQYFFDRRWDDDQVNLFLSGGTPDVAQDMGPVAPAFEGYATPAELGDALRSDWEMARRAVASPATYRNSDYTFVDAVRRWLADLHWSRSLPAFRDIGKVGGTPVDVVIAYVLNALLPVDEALSIPLVGGGAVPATPSDVAALAAKVLSEGEEPSVYSETMMNTLYQGHMLQYLARGQNDSLNQIDGWWHWSINRLEEYRRWAVSQASADRERIRTANRTVLGDPGDDSELFFPDAWELQANDNTVEVLRSMALLLGALADPANAAKLSKDIKDNYSDAFELEWFADLVSDRPVRAVRTTGRLLSTGVSQADLGDQQRRGLRGIFRRLWRRLRGQPIAPLLDTRVRE